MTRRTARWRWISVVPLLAALLGCGKEAPPRPRGLLDAQGRPVEGRQRKARPETTEDSTEQEEPAAAPSALPSPFAEEAPPPVEEVKEEEAPRDLGKELSEALGEPAACLDVDKAGALGGATIRFTAILLTTGRVSRATVTAQGQPPSALRCLEEQLAGLSLAPPIKDAPVTVSGETTVQVMRIPPKQGPTAAPSSTTMGPPPELAKPEENPEFAQPEVNPEIAGSPDRR